MGVFTSFQQQLTKTITRLEYPELPPYRWSPIKEKSFISVLPTKDGLAPIPLVNPKNSSNPNANFAPFEGTYPNLGDYFTPGRKVMEPSKIQFIAVEKYTTASVLRFQKNISGCVSKVLNDRYTPKEQPLIGSNTPFYVADAIQNVKYRSNVFHSPAFFSSEVSYKLTEGLGDTIKKTSFKSWLIKEVNPGIINEDLDITLEVYRLSEYRFNFPNHYLDGLSPNEIARVEGNTLIIFTHWIGEVMLYTNHAKIKVRTLPGLRSRKINLSGIGP
jgi:hypothetical protein